MMAVISASGGARDDRWEHIGRIGPGSIGRTCRVSPWAGQARMTPSLFPVQSVQAQSIQAGGQTIQPEVLASIQQASANTGMDFSYLMAQASRESSFDPTAKASTSSASGLYQFVEQTWLGE